MILGYRVSAPAVGGIKFGEWLFSEPEVLPASPGLAGFLNHEGVYAILTDDASCRPRPFRVLYFGETENLWARATSEHENFPAWRREIGLYGKLYRAFHLMPASSQPRRQMVESALIEAYNPPCNKRLSFSFLK
jgi:hypothetical protein